MSHREVLIGRQPSALYKLMYLKLPQFQKTSSYGNTLDVERIAEYLRIRRQNVYRWLKANELPARRVKQVIALPGSELTTQDLEPYASSN